MNSKTVLHSMPPLVSISDSDKEETSQSVRFPVLHLMNGIVDSSIASMVADQIGNFCSGRYEWHVGGLNVVEFDRPFLQLGSTVVDFSESSRNAIELIRNIRQHIIKNRIRLVHTHTPRTTVVAAFALIGLGRSVRLLTTKHLHAVPRERSGFGVLYTLVDRLAVYSPDHIVAVSQDVGKKILSMPRISSERVTIIQNAVDLEAYSGTEQREKCREELGLNQESMVVGFAGRLTRQKRIDLLLRAFQVVAERHENAKLLICGDGEERASLEALAQQYGLTSKVIWTGHRSDMPRLFSAMDVYVQSSINEGLSLSLLQAMAAEKPVVATDVGGTREVVKEHTGILISPGSSDRIAEAILWLSAHPEKTVQMIAQARQLVEEKFSVQRQMSAYGEVYRRLLSHPCTSGG